MDDKTAKSSKSTAAARRDRPIHQFTELFRLVAEAPEDDKPILHGVPFAQHLGIRITHGEAGRVRMMVPYDERMIGDTQSGVLHGGVVTTLLDSCAGLAAGSSESKDTAVATLDLRIDYLRPATPGKPIHAEAETYRETSQIDFVRAIAHQGDPDDPVATAVATFMSGGGATQVMSWANETDAADKQRQTKDERP